MDQIGSQKFVSWPPNHVLSCECVKEAFGSFNYTCNYQIPTSQAGTFLLDQGLPVKSGYFIDNIIEIRINIYLILLLLEEDKTMHLWWNHLVSMQYILTRQCNINRIFVLVFFPSCDDK